MSVDTEILDAFASILSLTAGMQIFFGLVPPTATADPVVSIGDFGGPENESGMRNALWTINVRGTSYETTKTFAEGIFEALKGMRLVLTSSIIYRIHPLSSPAWLGPDDRDRQMFSIRLVLSLAK